MVELKLVWKRVSISSSSLRHQMAGRVGAAVVGTACVASVLLVGGSYQFILGRQEELAMHLKEEAARRQRHSTSPGLAAGPEEISAMLIGVKGKTFSQKLEAVHDGAIETHKIGFPDSRHART